MSGQRVTLYRCSHCPNQLTYLEPVSRREHGVNLQFGHSYCTAGEKIPHAQKERVQVLSARLVSEKKDPK